MSASGNRAYLAVAKETVPGTINTNPVLYKKRHTAGNIVNSKDTFESGELRTDRATSDIRMGVDQPELSMDVELSYNSYDDLFQWALGNNKIGGFNFTHSVNFGDGTATITSAGGSDWTTLGVYVGATLYINGANTPANDGIYVISTITDGGATNDVLTVTLADGTTAATFTVDAADSITILGGWYAERVTTSAGVVDLTVSNTTKTMTLSGTGSPTWNVDEIQPGDWLVFNGFTNAGNNDTWFQVQDVTTTVITFKSTTTLVDESVATATDIDMTTASAHISSIIAAGQVLTSFSISEGFTDASEYWYSTGNKVSSFNFDFTTGDITSGNFSMMGRAVSDWAATEISGSSIVEPGTDSVMDGFGGSLYLYDPINDTPAVIAQCIVTSASFTYDNSLENRLALFQREACDQAEGRISATGDLEMYFADSTYAQHFDDETILTLKLMPNDTDGNQISFIFPRIKFTADSRSKTETDVTESLSWTALGGNTVHGPMGIVLSTNMG